MGTVVTNNTVHEGGFDVMGSSCLQLVSCGALGKRVWTTRPRTVAHARAKEHGCGLYKHSP